MLWSTSLPYNYFKEGQYLKQNKTKQKQKTPMTLCRNNTIHPETHILFLLVFLQVQIAQSKFCQSTRDGRPNKEFTIQKILTQRRSVGKQQIERFSYLHSIITKALILFSLSLKLRKILELSFWLHNSRFAYLENQPLTLLTPKISLVILLTV